METLRQDLKDAFRSLRKSPGYTATALLTLALAIGANTALFSVVDAVLLRSLPFDDPGPLVLLWGNVERQEVERRGASYPDFLDWRSEATAFSGMAAYWDGTTTLYGDGEPERLDVEVVSPAYFDLLGVTPAAGRLFTAAEETPGAPGAVLLGHELWQRRFGGGAVLGRTLRLGADDFTVAGVLPPGFRGLSDQAALWLNVGADLDAESAAQRGARWFPALARLRPGVTREAAQAELDAVSHRLEAAYPDTNEKRGVEVAALTEELVGELRPLLLVAQGAVGVVLLLAAANVAGLALARAHRRRRELAVRAALGAGRGRLVRQLVVEGLVLALAAAAAGVVLAGWLADALVAASPVELPGFAEVTLSRPVLGVTIAAATLLGIALGLAPATRAPLRALAQTLRDATARTTGRHGSRLRGGLVVGEVALALALLVGAGLLLRSLASILAIDPGFRPEGALTLWVSLPPLPEDAAPAGSTALAVLERFAALPGVRHAALASDVPYGGGSAIFYTAEGEHAFDATNFPRAYVHDVTPGFFAALGTEVLRGRALTRGDVESEAPVVVVTQAVAERFWPGADPVGRRVRRANDEAPWLEVVGVVPDLRYRGLPDNPTADPDLFFPFRADRRGFAVVLRSDLDPASLVAAATAAVREVEPAATVYDVAPLAERVASELARPRFAGGVTALFGVLALLLAAIGVYGVVAESVGGRTREIGVRVALGAAPRQIRAMVLREGLLLALLGIAIGALGALAASRALGSLLYGVRPTDPTTFAVVALLVAAAALAATWLPARRALRADPVKALRAD